MRLHRKAGFLRAAIGLIVLSYAAPAIGQDAELCKEAFPQAGAQAMRKAAEFYRTKVATRGGYVYYYSPDLQQRWGEGVASPNQIWVQPSGTPTVGMAYLNAYEATGDQFYLDAAKDAAEALVYGQLRSGGWTNAIDFDPRGRRVAQYRNGKGNGKNNSTLDDDISQAAMRFLMRVDQALDFENERIHEAAMIALDALLEAQFANGGFPQVWTAPVDRDKPILKANYPKHDWRTEGRIKNYWDMYTLNDGLAGTVAQTLIDAHQVYGDEKYKEALARLGDFLLLAQMPDPQPAWAQQYNYQMQPIWARRFEPAAITGGESQDALETLMTIYEHTGDKKYLAPIPRALAYLKKSQLADGSLARYYELETNRPLYMTRRGGEYTLTYDDSNLPRHYGWKVESRLDEIERRYKQLASGEGLPSQRSGAVDEAEVGEILNALDEHGRWISRARGERLVGQPRFPVAYRYISSAIFSRNMEALSEYVLQWGRD